MGISSIFFIAIGLAMDAFAASICKGLQQAVPSADKTVKIGACFGIFQALMPILGFLLASTFANQIKSIDHWVAFFLLGFIGIQMIKESREAYCEVDRNFDYKTLIILGVATSIDAMAVGISFAFLDVNIIQAAILIGLVTFLISMFGFNIGNKLGIKSKQIAEFAGGVILIIMGSRILIEHLFFGA